MKFNCSSSVTIDSKLPPNSTRVSAKQGFWLSMFPTDNLYQISVIEEYTRKRPILFSLLLVSSVLFQYCYNDNILKFTQEGNIIFTCIIFMFIRNGYDIYIHVHVLGNLLTSMFTEKQKF